MHHNPVQEGKGGGQSFPLRNLEDYYKHLKYSDFFNSAQSIVSDERLEMAPIPDVLHRPTGLYILYNILYSLHIYIHRS